jgi:aminoglycoside/choline kinase family phosphotransferase
MKKDELLSLLFNEYTGNIPESLMVLPKSGSDRIYCRMVRGNFSALGVWNPNRKENDAFVGYARHFRDIGLRVPEVYRYIPGKMVYLTEDLGDLDLYAWIMERKNGMDGKPEIEEMYKSVLRELLKFQFDADKAIDYSLAHPRKVFDRSSVMWDLYYFKYMFLKLSGTGFNEQLLEEDFVKLADRIEDVMVNSFLYRDFQSRNIMIKDGVPWFIDFQGGRKGAPLYDLASLLLDPYVELDNHLHDRLLEFYYSIAENKIRMEWAELLQNYPFFGIVRLCQALGAYGFRGLYERKPNFTDSIPPAVRQLKRMFETKSMQRQCPELCRIIGTLIKNT